MPDMETAAQEAVNEGVTVVLSSRLGGGRVPLIKARDGTGFISADNLNPQKARVLLILALASSAKPATIVQYFSEY